MERLELVEHIAVFVEEFTEKGTPRSHVALAFSRIDKLCLTDSFFSFGSSFLENSLNKITERSKFLSNPDMYGVADGGGVFTQKYSPFSANSLHQLSPVFAASNSLLFSKMFL